MRIERTTAAVVRPLRAALLRDGDLDAATWPGDEESTHLAALTGDEVIGCLSLLAEACPDLPERAAWRLRGMAVRRDSHRRGIGSALIAAAAAAAGQQRIDLIWCNARTSALPFYRAVGWQAIGEEFLTDTGIPHYRALLDLAGFDPSGRVVG